MLFLFTWTLIFSNFSVLTDDNDLKGFCSNYTLKIGIHESTICTTPSNPSCITFMLTNPLQNLQWSCAIEIGLCGFNKMPVTIMKD